MLNWLKEPIFGFGYGSFGVEYLKWQSNYFRDGGTSDEEYLADTVYVAFNEPLQILLETGLAGFLICVTLSLVIFNAKCLASEDRVAFGSVKAVLLFILASAILTFSFHSTATLFLMIIGLAALQEYGDFRALVLIRLGVTTTKFLVFSCSIIVWILIYQSIVLVRSYHEWYSIRKSNAIAFSLHLRYQNLYRQLKYDPLFITEYASICEDAGMPETSIKLLERMNEFDTRIDTYV